MAMSQEDVRRIEQTLFYEPPEMRQRLLRFTMLILFASIIATGGLLSDSVASIIGAMIVAPLMTPIMGMVVAIILGSSSRLARSAIIVLLGVVLAISVGWLMATLMPTGWVATSSDQVLARTSPKLLDLIIALASGGAGAYALSRVDVADALPGVAIAISLVPPLNTVGILLAGNEGHLAMGALVLFLTNMGAILLAGTITFMATNLLRAVGRSPRQLTRSLVAIGLFVLLIAVPLRANSTLIWQDATREDSIRQIVQDWLPPTQWEIYAITVDGDEVTVTIGGSGDLPPASEALDEIRTRYGSNMMMTFRIVDVRTEVIPPPMPSPT